ncbi:MAG: penicillin acylase family protein [Hyphomicrobiaceae bacterium]
MPAMPQPTQSLSVPGADGAIELLVDRQGVTHIFAQSIPDAFFGQGFNAARDRLWQLEMWRRRGLGLTAEVFGPGLVERDRVARLLLYRGDMDAEWAAYGPNAKAWTTAFTRGINAFVSLARAEPERLPLEFVASGLLPSFWSPEDVVRCRAHARVKNLDTEVARANVATSHGLDQAAYIKALNPPWPLTYPEGVEPEAVPADVMTAYRLATALLDLSGAEIPAAHGLESLDGSNNWAVRPELSTTGRPLLATDPHRQQELPSLRYTVHLNAPGLNVIGAGEPAIPGVSLGHNERIAFGLTIFPTDQEDLYIYELDADDPNRYRYGDGFEAFREIKERIPVRDADPVEVTLQFTRHGPVLHHALERGRAYAVRTVWTEPGTAAYMASLRYIQATCWDEFVAAQSGWGAPSVNHVYADVDGNVGWITAGKLPHRPNWDGLLPVPGDGRFEWQGFLDPGEHPRAFNPAQRWVGSANQMNLPEGFDHARHKTGFEFAPGGRFRRITEVLNAGGPFSLDDFATLQADVQCPAALAFAPRLNGMNKLDGDAGRARALLSGWDLQLSVDSPAAALSEIWLQRHMLPAAMRLLSPPAVIKHIEMPDADLLVRTFNTDAPDGLWKETLAAAWADATALLGPDPEAWRWGDLHRLTLRHLLSPVLGAQMARRLDLGPIERAGSGLTVNNNGYLKTDFSVQHGVAWRMLADVGNWDACRFINSPGQSGDPASPHYGDHFAIWGRDAYLPLHFSRAAIEADLERRIVLEPS